MGNLRKKLWLLVCILCAILSASCDNGIILSFKANNQDHNISLDKPSYKTTPQKQSYAVNNTSREEKIEDYVARKITSTILNHGWKRIAIVEFRTQSMSHTDLEGFLTKQLDDESSGQKRGLSVVSKSLSTQAFADLRKDQSQVIRPASGKQAFISSNDVKEFGKKTSADVMIKGTLTDQSGKIILKAYFVDTDNAKLYIIEEPIANESSGPGWLNGTWEGTGSQGIFIKTTWKIRLVAGPNSYSVSYPSLGCGGYWSLIQAGAETASFTEHINYGKDRCVDNVFVTVKKLSMNQLECRWSSPAAKATLTLINPERH